MSKGYNNWKCEICGNIFSTRAQLFQHRKETTCGIKQMELGHKKSGEAQKKQWLDGKRCGHKCSEATKQKMSKAAIEHSYWEHRSREPIIYESKVAGKLNLDSYWELYVAQRLDLLNVKWYRPKVYLEYYTKDNKLRYYCPDFYVEDYNCFIEVKSPYILQRQNENGKIDYLKANYNFIIWLESEDTCKNFSLTKKDYNGDKPSILEENFIHKNRSNLRPKLKAKNSKSKIDTSNGANIDLYNKRKRLIEESNIDFLSFGWVEQVANLFGISHSKARKYIEKRFPEIKTYKRKSPGV